ncbi:enoyl-CoA hydratase [Verminephrobacter aporrectodeae subsp. tuberculatae]|uniref:Enoyl-CoA hydratase n=1 Tax=Verminephrobacter aporrectodeae subsp. tuberculatae TaxID=1110392 RepID=A0ABT3KNF1_9BURK|nr:enoyl-CoA hydratase [Verminephrobacter aporrectodeae]MCW5319832.1 enoyl-CoA hydratase [Verminephrobacter aporrectodeae subsp. tuberculatae]
MKNSETGAAPKLQHAAIGVDPQGVATLTIREAGSLNILGTPVITDLISGLRHLAGDSRVRAVVLRGTGDKAFVAGADIREMGALDTATAKLFIDNLRQLCEAVRQFPTPVIARIPGWTLGGGLELAMACDIRIAASQAHFGMPEVKVGIPSIIHAALMPGLIGNARANWMLLTGDNIDAAKAAAWGLVDTVVNLEELDQEVARVANQFASYGPSVLRQQKRLLREWKQDPLDRAIENGVGEFASAFATGEPQRFMQAFVDKKAASHAAQA